MLFLISMSKRCTRSCTGMELFLALNAWDSDTPFRMLSLGSLLRNGWPGMPGKDTDLTIDCAVFRTQYRVLAR